MAKQSILIVEDDPTWQDLFAEVIEDAGFQPVVVSTEEAAAEALRSCNFALVVVDISLSLPDHAHRGGVRVLQRLAASPTRIPAIVVTGYATVELAIETLAELRAAHFFQKENFKRREFIKAVHTETRFDEAIAPLSRRELEVLELLSRGYTNKQIAEALTVTVNTIKKHLQSIFTKLNVDSRAAAVAKAFKRDNLI